MSKLHYYHKGSCGYESKSYLRFINELLKEGKQLYKFKEGGMI